MKMNLSVVMGVVDKVSEPLQSMASDSDHYAKKIKAIQKAQADDSSALTMIASYQKIQKELDKNALETDEANEKLAKLKAQMAATEAPSAALTNKLAKQEEKVSLLSAKNEKYESSLKQTSSQMKKAGVNVTKLDHEFTRLSKDQEAHAKSIDKVSRRYKTLRTAMSPIQKLSKSIKLPNIKGAAIGKGAALLGGLSFAGLFQQINSAAGEMDHLSKSAQNLNMPVEELQAMQSQAEHAGVSADGMAKALGTFSKRLGVLQSTGKGAAGSFLEKAKSPLFNQLKNAKTTQDAYDKVLDTFTKLKTNQEQMAFADAMFGGESKKMLIMLRQGTEGLTAARKDFNETGGGVKTDDAQKAEAYNDAMQKVQETIRSIKFAALAPVMLKVTKLFTEFSNKFKNEQFRTDLIEKITKTISGLCDAFGLIAKVAIFVTQNIKGVIAALAIFKVGMIAVNAVIMMNPIGLMVAAIGAAIIAITYLIDKFIGFDVIIKAVTDAIGWLWEGIKSLIGMLPDALVPDSWQKSVADAGAEVDTLNSKLKQVKDTNAKLGITTNETTNRTSHDQASTQRQGLSNTPALSAYQPLNSHTVKSQSEVAVTIKSEKPITVDKAKSDKSTNLNLNVGNMAMSY
ncbi:hypothetical protein HC725_02225 [Vibrio sp. S17_S38]|uniref:hypothetical protein n=1 Tax=Vibrio sp. S17_S38 TaxID=2720229 RepID=UPI00167FE61A|nr:hypothetical protein [Vibrio sp. S17_S38]MBD1572096.1 hypothetical protein [Vibrio sp. S17_S38]